MKAFAVALALGASACTVASGDIFSSDDESDGGVSFSCPLPSAGRVTVCGQVIDAQTSEPVANGEVLVVDPADLMGVPTSLASATSDGEGAFVAADFTPPLGGEVALLTGEFPAVTRLLTATVVGSTPGQATQAAAFVTRVETRDEWETAIGASLAGGFLVSIYVDIAGESAPLAGAPLDGVEITRNDVVDATDAFYFSDADPSSRTMFGGAATSASGSVLRRAPIAEDEYSGARAGCTFSSIETTGISQLIQVQQIFASCP